MSLEPCERVSELVGHDRGCPPQRNEPALALGLPLEQRKARQRA